jgi:hypothetical protein
VKHCSLCRGLREDNGEAADGLYKELLMACIRSC